MKIVVIGAGVIGSAAAYALARAGAQVVVCEARYPGAGASGESYAWVNANRKSPYDYFALNLAGLRAHDTWHRELAEDAGPLRQWLWRTGHYEWSTGTGHAQVLTDKLARMAGWGYPADVLDRREALRREPALRLAPDVGHVVSYPQESICVPEAMIATLLRAAEGMGAQVRAPAEVVGAEPRGTGARAHLADGSAIDADVIVGCAGRWTDRVAATAGSRVPMAPADAAGQPAIGLLAYTRPRALYPTRLLTTSRLNVRPRPDGGLVLHALDLDRGIDPNRPASTTGPEARELLRRLDEVLVLPGPERIDRMQIGRRAIPADGRTVAGFVGDGRWLYAIATHSGVTLAPVLAEHCAAEVVAGNTVDQLAPFRPDRFADWNGLPETPRALVPGDQ
ncbi:NAD(P)/FAD-dependent oxidoreductase [Nocardiopsis mangrovi]|uniref:NAD(P)/FAD-dependent oxidoreductase n=1 Tax=Nocardiopsis mangrovi TaxID=1179818 RepID=A0ABV9DU37_9ACTN